MISRIAFLAAAFAALACTAQARDQVPAEERYYSYDAARVPGCSDPVVLNRLMARFKETEASYWSSDLEILSVSNIRTTHFRANGVDFVPRRHCRGTAHLNNRRASRVYYEVTQDAGMVGHDFGLRFCVAAYDRQWAFAPECKAARP